MAASSRKPDVDEGAVLRRATDRMLEGLQIVNRDWRYVYLNETAARHGRRPREELLGRTMMECYPGIEATPLFEHLRAAIEQRRPQLLENEFTYPDGSVAWFELRIEPCDVGVLILSIDISRRKRAEREVQRHLLRLERSNEDLEQFAHVAAHDLRAPLRQIGSCVELLREQLGEVADRDAADYLRSIEVAAQRMTDMVRELLRYSTLRDDEAPFEPVELDDVLDDVLLDFEKRIRDSGARIERDPLPAVRSTRTLMHRLLGNLVENALKYHRTGDAPALRIAAEEADRDWSIWIEDEGIGLPPRAGERLFRLFQRLHAASDRTEPPGPGLGLAICRRIVELHGGSIRADPAATGGGTRLTFTIPKSGVL